MQRITVSVKRGKETSATDTGSVFVADEIV